MDQSPCRECALRLIAVHGQPTDPTLYQLVIELAFLEGRASLATEQLEDHRSKYRIVYNPDLHRSSTEAYPPDHKIDVTA